MIRFRGCLFERLGQYGARVEDAFDVPWREADILDVFGEQPAIDKSAQQLWAAAQYREGANRGNAGLNHLWAATLDCDCADIGTLDAVITHVRNQGLACLAYTSWSHMDPEKVHKDTGRAGPFEAFRIVLPYSRPLAPAEHQSVVPALLGIELPADPPHYAKEVIGRYVERGQVETAARPRGWDPASFRPAQGFYVPSSKSSVDVFQGKSLNVDAILARPQTSRVTNRRARPFQAPNRAAMGALGTVLHKLAARGIGATGPSAEGWYRSVCPSCASAERGQRSPSFTVRANGDGVDIRCHAQCTRRDLLKSLELDGVGAFRPPTHLRVALEEQLLSQAPPEDDISADEAGERLEADIREAVVERRPTIVKYPAGTGKSFRSARIIAEHVRAGLRIAYATQEHAVAHETRALLPPDVRARSVHIHSPLVQVGSEPVCRRAEEVKTKVFEFGVSLLGQVCPRCLYRGECPALAAAKQRQQDLPEASAIFVSHAGIGQVFGVDADGNEKGADLQLIVDEMPGTFDAVTVTFDDLKLLAQGAPMPSAQVKPMRAAQEIARAWLAGTEPGEVVWGPGGASLGHSLDIAREWRRMVLVERATPREDEAGMLKAADAVLRISVADDEGNHAIVEDGTVSAMLPEPAHEALVSRRGVLLSATPMVVALPGFALKEAAVRDGAKVVRKMFLASGRGSQALTKASFDPTVRERRRGAGEGPGGMPWGDIYAALGRARSEAQRYDCRRILFVTFKALADELRRRPQPDVSVGHFGALRGKNDWMEGKAEECSVVYLLGAPRFAIMPTLQRLGLVGQAADDAWTAYAAAELAQAEGRLRLPRRTKPCTVCVEGDVAPSTWHDRNVDEIVEVEPGSAALDRALWWRGLPGVADACGVPEAQVWAWLAGEPAPIEQLESILPQSDVERRGLMARMPKALQEQILASPPEEE